MTEPIRCDVPGCPGRSTRFAGFAGWLCSRHWPLVPRRLRRRRAQLRRLLKKRGESYTTKHAWYATTPRANRLEDAIWRQMVRAATEAAAGI